MALEPIGVRATAENVDGYQRLMQTIQNATNAASNVIQKAAQRFNVNTKAVGLNQQALQNLSKRIQDVGREFLSKIPIIGQYADEIIAATGATGLLIAGTLAAAAAIVVLGAKGGEIKGVADSFRILATSAGQVADQFLGKLREATALTITDFELMRQTNVALAGATGEFAKQFAENLPKVLQIARLQAQSTGQSVEHLVSSLVTGIKRASPLLIDNTGITLKIGEANEILAQKLGKSVEALSSEEKQLAVLNAVLDAGDGIIRQYGDAQEYANLKLARAQTILQNIVNNIQVALEPLASAILNVVNPILVIIETIINGVIKVEQPIINTIATIVNAFMNTLAPVLQFIGEIFNAVFTAIGSIVETVLAPFQVLIEVFGKVGNAALQFIIAPLRVVLNFISGAVNFIVGLARSFLKAGAAIIGALAAGILRAANDLVIPAVTAVASFIADFLVGQSPPPKGPLSKIDQGGAATMEAWLAGFMGVGLEPVGLVAARVAQAMGDIAAFSLEQVEARIETLDAALNPFRDQLEIIKARFDALKPATDAAFSSIDRQLEKAVQALTKGDAAALAQVRSLDTQRAALEEYLAAQQEQIDQAQVQYALAQAQQAQERVLLDIRRRELELLEEKDPIIKQQKEKELKAAKEQAAKGGAGAGAGGIGGLGGVDTSMPKQPGSGFVDELKGAFGEGFDMFGGKAELERFKTGSKAIQSQMDRIAGAPLFKGIQEGFNQFVGFFNDLPNRVLTAIQGIGMIVDTALLQPIKAYIAAAFDPGNPDGIAGKWDYFWNGTGPGSLDAIVRGPLTWINNVLIVPLQELFRTLYTNIFDVNTGGSLAWLITNFFTADGQDTLKGILQHPFEWLDAIFVQPFRDWFNTVIFHTLDLGNPDSFGSKLYAFFTGTGEGTLDGILSSAGQALKNLGNIFIVGLNGILRGIETFINNNLMPGFQVFIAAVIAVMEALGDTSSEAHNALFQFGQGLAVSFGQIPLLKRGGILGKGAFIAGERGPEVGMSAAPFAMFSNRFVEATERFASIMAQPLTLPLPGAATYNNQNYDNSQQTNNFYGVQGGSDIVRRLSLLRAAR